MLRRIAGIMTVLLLVAVPGGAQEQSPVHPCGPQDVVGTWSLVQLRPNIPVPDELDPDFLPYQVWVFTSGGRFIKAGRLTPFTAADSAAIPARAQDRVQGTTYQVFEDKAALVLYPKEAPAPYLFSCFVVAQPYQDEKRGVEMRLGDLLLDLRTSDGRTIILGHHFRKVQE